MAKAQAEGRDPQILRQLAGAAPEIVPQAVLGDVRLMAKLAQRSDRMLFAPLIWRLAMKMEKVQWREVAGSAAETVYVLRAAQRLFRQDIHCVSFDTWLEAEAIGMHIERDRFGAPVGRPGR